MAKDAKNIRPSRDKPSDGTAKHWAVLVGITRYQQIGQPDLKYCVEDVKKLKDVLENRVGYDEVALFDNERATKGRIEKEICHVADVAPPDAVLLFHFSGHGIAEAGRSYLIAADTRAPFAQNGIDILALQRELAEKYRRRKVVFVLDCCRVPVGRSAIEGRLARGFILPKTKIPDGMAILYSCQEGGIAREMEDKKHGAFTHYFIHSLINSGQEPTLQEVYDRTKAEVRSWSEREKHDPIQEPTWVIHGDIHQLPIAVPTQVDWAKVFKHLERGNTAYDKGELIRAYEEWIEVKNLKQDHLLEDEKFRRAEEAYKKAQKVTDIVTQRLPAAREAIIHGYYDIANDQLDSILDVNPSQQEALDLRNDILLRRELAKLHGQLKNEQEAKNHTGIVELCEKIIGLCNKVLILGSDDQEVHEKKKIETQQHSKIAQCHKEGEEALNHKNYEEAIAAWEKLLNLSPDDEEGTARLKLAKELNESAKATKAAQQGDHHAAHAAWKRILDLSPKNAKAKKGAAEAQRQLRIQAHRTQARDAFTERQYDQAIQQWEAVLKLESGDKEARENIARVQRLIKLRLPVDELKAAVESGKDKAIVQAVKAILPLVAVDSSGHTPQVEKLEQTIADFNRRITALTQENDTLTQEAIRLKHTLDQRDSTIQKLNADVDERTLEISRLKATRPQRSTRNEGDNSLEQRIEELEELVKQFRFQVDKQEIIRRFKEGAKFFQRKKLLKAYEAWQWVMMYSPNYPIDQDKFQKAKAVYEVTVKKSQP